MRVRVPSASALTALAFSATLALCFGGGCADDEAFEGAAPVAEAKAPIDTCAPGRARSSIVTKLAFTREAPKGVAPGFDLDKRVSDGSDEESCLRVDFTDAEGTPGIDNQLAALLPDIEGVVGNAVDGLIQGAINNGELLIMMELDSVDDPVNDACVHQNVQLAKGLPMLGTDGVIEGFQTFRLDTQAPLNRAENGKISGGVVTAGPVELGIPIKIFDVNFILKIHQAYFHYTMDEDGYIAGYLGGGIVPDEVIEGLKDGAGLGDILPIFRLALKSSADLDPDENGKCRQVSAALEFKAAPAFIRR
jgi:hypothetical protein